MARIRPRRAVLFALFRVFAFCIFILPLNAALRLGCLGGRLCFHVLKRERVKALNNLNIAFGDAKTPEEKKSIALKVFENLGKNLVEVICLSKFNVRNIDRYIACGDGIGRIRDMISGGKGLIAVSAHFGNWELLAHYLAMKGLPVNVIARRVRMEGLERFLSGIRKRNNVKVIYRDSSAKEAIDLLRKGGCLGIMPDQDMDSVKGVFVDFFNKKAYTPSGPAVLNYLTGSPIVCFFMVRRGFGHEILVEGPLRLAGGGPDRDKDILENVRSYTRIIENHVRKFPSHWVWFHDRWKTKEPQ
ncbi:MAG: lysophospholipid acyltransferase family protein [Candidatus Omnitrophota bacterium]